MKLHEKLRGYVTSECPFKEQQCASVLSFPPSSSAFQKRLSKISCPFFYFLHKEIRIVFLGVLLKRGWLLEYGDSGSEVPEKIKEKSILRAEWPPKPWVPRIQACLLTSATAPKPCSFLTIILPRLQEWFWTLQVFGGFGWHHLHPHRGGSNITLMPWPLCIEQELTQGRKRRVKDSRRISWLGELQTDQETCTNGLLGILWCPRRHRGECGYLCQLGHPDLRL